MTRRSPRRLGCPVLTAVLLFVTAVSPDVSGSPDGEFYYEPVTVEAIEGRSYVALPDIARIFSATTTWHWRDKRIVLSILGNEITLLVDSPLALIGPTSYNLYQPTRIINSRIFVSPLLVTGAIASVTGKELFWEADPGRFRIPALPATVVGLETEISESGTDLILMLTQPLQYRFDRSPDGRFVLSLEEGRLSRNVETRLRDTGNIELVELKQTPTHLLASIRPGQDVTYHQVDLLPDPFRIRIRFQTSPYDSTAHEAIEQSVGGILAGRDKFDIVVIDPGHGGTDPGAIGRSYRTEEKEITLKIGLILAQLLRERLGVKVILTRSDDTLVPLRRRAELANQNKADLFVSIHCNAHRSRNIAGFELYFLGHAKTDHARAVAQMENEAVAFETKTGVDKNLEELGFIFWDLAQNAYLEESSRVAEAVNNAMGRGLSLRSRGVHQSGFTVLLGAFMPSLLVETAYLSNRQEERYLRSAEGQREIADSIFNGVRAYKDQHDRRLKPID